MDRNYLKDRVGDRIIAVLAAAGFNFGLLLRWLAELLGAIIRAFAKTVMAQKIASSAIARVLHGGLSNPAGRVAIIDDNANEAGKPVLRS
jgi:hypothetical protein